MYICRNLFQHVSGHTEELWVNFELLNKYFWKLRKKLPKFVGDNTGGNFFMSIQWEGREIYFV